MWLKLLSYDANTHETTEVCSLAPSLVGVLCDLSVIEDAIEEYKDIEDVELAICAITQPYFNPNPIPNQVAAFAYRVAGEEAYNGTEMFVVVWE